MYNNIVWPDKPQTSMWLMRIVCWPKKTVVTHTAYEEFILNKQTICLLYSTYWLDNKLCKHKNAHS